MPSNWNAVGRAPIQHTGGNRKAVAVVKAPFQGIFQHGVIEETLDFGTVAFAVGRGGEKRPVGDGCAEAKGVTRLLHFYLRPHYWLAVGVNHFDVEGAHAQLPDSGLGGFTPVVVYCLAAVHVEADGGWRLLRRAPILETKSGNFDDADAEAEPNAKGRSSGSPGE